MSERAATTWVRRQMRLAYERGWRDGKVYVRATGRTPAQRAYDHALRLLDKWRRWSTLKAVDVERFDRLRLKLQRLRDEAIDELDTLAVEQEEGLLGSGTGAGDGGVEEGQHEERSPS